MKLFFIVGLIAVALTGCNKVASITGGPADGHDFQWYQAHHIEAKSETDYCIKKYNGPDATPESMAKIPNYCMMASNANQNYINNLASWASSQNACGKANNSNEKAECTLATTWAKRYKINPNSKEAQDALKDDLSRPRY